MAKNYYDILGVNKNATQGEIKKAFVELCKKYHPDKNNGDDTKFKEVNEAYSTLGNEEERKKYDFQQSGGFRPGGFNTGFGNFNFRGFNISMRITISLEEAYNGCKRNVNANGRLYTVDIPKGITNGKVLRIPNLGMQGGDLEITILIPNDNNKLWLNENGLLEVMCCVDWIDAILGSEMTVKVFDRDVKFRVPKFTQNGGYTIVGGQGFRKFKSDELGNLKVNFIIRMPKSLTDEQIKLLQNIKESL